MADKIPDGPPPSYEESISSSAGRELYPSLPEKPKSEPPVAGAADMNGIELIVKASDFAARRHRQQKRKDPAHTPFICHPIGVAYILTNEAKIFDPVVLAAAILHDTVEDTKTTHEELVTIFGSEVAGIVAECTDDKTKDKAFRKQALLDSAASHSHAARLVHLADKLYNVRDVERVAPLGWSPRICREYVKGAQQLLERLRGTHAGLEEALEAVINRYLSK